MRCSTSACLWLAWLTSPGFSAPDSGLALPYSLQVGVESAPHRIITPVFREQFRRDLSDALRIALGPLLRDSQGRSTLQFVEGLRLPDAGQVTPHKSINLRLDFQDGQYVLTCTIHDGWTGQRHLPRVARTTERALVARIASQLIGIDLGINGLADPTPVGDLLTLRLKGGDFAGIDWDRWVRDGEVFALSRVRPATVVAKKSAEPKGLLPASPLAPSLDWNAGHGEVIADTLLKVVEPVRNGAVKCRIISRYQSPLASGDVAYRAVKLGTVVAPLRVRLIDEDGRPMTGLGLKVRANSTGQPDRDPSRDELPLDSGQFKSREPIAHAAFVWVESAGQIVARRPVVLFDDSPIVITVRREVGAELVELLIRDRQSLVRQVNERQTSLRRQFSAIEALVTKAANDDALKALDAMRTSLDSDRQRFNSELARLRKESGQLTGPVAQKFRLDELEQAVKGLDIWNQPLSNLRVELTKAIAAANDPKYEQVRQLATQARLRRDQADFEGAIKLYEQAIKLAPEVAQIKGELEALKKGWQLADGEHEKARKFVYEQWAQVATYPQIRDNLPRLRECIAKFAAVGDRLTPIKILLSIPSVSEVLQSELKRFNPEDGPEAKQSIEAIQKTIDELVAVSKLLTESLSEKK